MDFKKTLEKFTKEKKNKYIYNLLILSLFGILLILGASMFKDTNASVQNNKDTSKEVAYKEGSSYETTLENQLKERLEKMDGVGKVSVMIYFEGGEEQVPAVNLNDSTNVTDEKDTSGGTRNTTQKNNGSTVVITSDGSKNEPLIVKKYKPKITGVLIVAEGAEDKIVELNIRKAVSNLFNISYDKLNVYPMKK